METFVNIYFIFMSTIFGVVIGSFLNVVIYRIPAGRQIVKGHSACMTCGHDLAAKDLIPIISWCSLKGKCRYCGAPITSRYTKIESFTGVIFLLASICSFQKSSLIILIQQQITVFYFVYYVLMLLTFAALISAMMIYYDTGKSFIGFPICVLSIRAVVILLPFVFNKVFVGDEKVISALSSLIQMVLTMGAYVLVTFLLFLVQKKKYSLSDLYLDITLNSVTLFGLYFTIGNSLIQTSITVIAYALLRSICKNGKYDKYVGIITVSAHMLTILSCFIYNLF